MRAGGPGISLKGNGKCHDTRYLGSSRKNSGKQKWLFFLM